MITYEIPATARALIHFFATVQDKEYNLKLLKADGNDYINASEALKILSDLFADVYYPNYITIISFPYFNKKQQGMLWIRIDKVDEYTLRVTKMESIDIKNLRQIQDHVIGQIPIQS